MNAIQSTIAIRITHMVQFRYSFVDGAETLFCIKRKPALYGVGFFICPFLKT